MTCSMTSFTSQQSDHEWGELVWEIRSVNHRYLEPSFRLPDSFRNLEPQLRDLLRKSLHRGKIDAQLKFSASRAEAGSSEQIQLNEKLLAQLHQASQKIVKSIQDAAPLNTLELLKWPGVIQQPEADIKAIEAHALTLFQISLESLIEQRLREGGALKEKINQRLDAINTILASIRKAMPEILSRQKEKLLSQFAEIELEIDHSRLEQELVLICQKADIEEEIDRLEIHLTEVTRTLSKDGPVGRKLDFLIQELNREANTICSKAIVTETSLSAVELKVQIEQMREQIQNIE